VAGGYHLRVPLLSQNRDFFTPRGEKSVANHTKTLRRWQFFHHLSGTDLTLQVMVSPQHPSPSQDSTRHMSTFYRGGGGPQSRHHSACEQQQKEQFDVTSLRRLYPTVPTTSCRGIDARFDGDIGYIVIDVSLIRSRVAMRGRGCRPQRVDIQQNKSRLGCNALASTASPNAPISLPLARGHLILDGQLLKRAHGWGGGCVAQEERFLFFHYSFYSLFFILC